jgi:hypothetical protein
MKCCSKCKVEKPLGEFFAEKRASDGRRSSCKTCFSKGSREYIKSHPEKSQQYGINYRGKTNRKSITDKDYYREYRRMNPEKTRVRTITSNAIRDGKLVKTPCRDCNTSVNIEAHHPDYTKPLEVIWLCKPHHMQLHRKLNLERKQA